MNVFLRIRNCLVFLFVVSITNSQAKIDASYNFSKIDDRHGLSQNHVKSIFQDSWGFIWFGTKNGLNRFDGEEIKRFNCFDKEANIGNNNISVIFEDVSRNLWIGTDKGVYIFDPLREEFSIFDKKSLKGNVIQDWVSEIKVDLQGNVWMVIPNQGLFRYELKTEKLFFYDVGMTQFPDHGNPQCLTVDKNGRVWIGSNGEGIYLYNSSEDSFNKYLGNSSRENLKGKNIYTICDYGDELIIGIHEGKLMKFHKNSKSVRDVNAKDVHYKIIRDVENIDGELWVGTQSGIFIIDEVNEKETWLQEDRLNEYSISDNFIDKIYRDRENGVWIGTKFGGVSYLPNRGMNFNIQIPLINGNSISGRRIREFVEDSSGNMWIGTEDAGLEVYNPLTNNYKRVESGVRSSLSSSAILGMYYDEKNHHIWVGYFKGGLDIVDATKQEVIAHYSKEDLGFNEGSIYAICEDKDGNIWIGNGWSVYLGDKERMRFQRMEEFGLNFIYDIQEDSEGNIWVATMGDGVFRYDSETKSIENFRHDPNDRTSLSSNSVSSITESSGGVLWFSTDRGGICRYHSATNNFSSYSIENGLPDDVAYKILEDSNGLLWFGTNKGLVKFNPTSFEVEVFSRDDGLPFNQFNYKSGIVSKSGLLYFGGLNGMIFFDPELAYTNTYVPPVYITDITVFNEKIEGTTTDSLKSSIIHLDQLILPYDESNLTIEFAALSYVSPLKNKYTYFLEGIDRDWVKTKENSVTYAKLPPGEYTFRVKGSNNDGVWNNGGDSIVVKILPPWWKSDAALTFYFLLILGGVYLTFYIFKRKHEKKNLVKQKDFEIKKEKELYSSKIEFFTNVAHEIRTPLTLINGPIESLMERGVSDSFVKSNLNIIAQNTQQLMNLINQLLDFRKIESNAFQVSFSIINISDLLFQTTEKFKVIAEQQHKRLNLKMPDHPIEFLADRDGLMKIFNNLFSNGLKFSETYVEIELIEKENFIIVKVANDGEKIPEDFQDKLFTLFSQSKTHNGQNGTGIGLSLVKSLVELHGGNILFDSESTLNVFEIHFPLLQEKVDELENAVKHLESDELGTKKQSEHEGAIKTGKILIVEDNKDMLNFIADKLQELYSVEKVENGEEAIEVLQKESIELIITDLMMPVMDGFALCEKVKTSLDFSHIPIIILTAKNDLKSKIEGLEKGADAYIEKPFSTKYMIAQVSNLLENKRRNRDVFLKKPFLPIQQMGMNKTDEYFLSRITGIIKENITEPDFTVERLSEMANMSRSSLHRKIKGLTGISPNEFIRLIRLKIAAELILENKYRIGEICYLVGINSPSYFTKLFQKQFGVSPKDFQRDSGNVTN
jgi:signal transduction histidine kinase/ligand-binding sensor domain-containing protein/DNA-binding response OmpR family regulator